MVYVLARNRKDALLPQLRDVFSKAEGIEHVYGTDQLPSIGLPVPATSDQAPDLVLTAMPDYAFSNNASTAVVTAASEGGTHGYLSNDPRMQAIFIAWGAGIRKGVRLGAITNLDVAPTIAALFGLKMEQVQGRVLQEILQ